jgi:hypothetical protein
MKISLPMTPIAIALLLTACSERTQKDSADASHPAAESEGVNYRELDKLAEEEIKAPNAAEARAWLSVPANAIFEGSKTEVIALTESFYRVGCPKVYVTGIEKLGGTFISASVVAVLPSDTSQRQGAFKVENEFSQKQGESGSKDKGQKYIWLSFD